MEQKLIFSQVMGTPMDYSVDFVWKDELQLWEMIIITIEIWQSLQTVNISENSNVHERFEHFFKVNILRKFKS